MEGIQFDEEQYITTNANSGDFNSNQSSMIKFVIKSGLAKNARQANIVILIVVLICIVVSVILFKSSVTKIPEAVPYNQLTPEQQKELPLEERMYQEQKQNNNSL